MMIDAFIIHIDLYCIMCVLLFRFLFFFKRCCFTVMNIFNHFAKRMFLCLSISDKTQSAIHREAHVTLETKCIFMNRCSISYLQIQLIFQLNKFTIKKERLACFIVLIFKIFFIYMKQGEKAEYHLWVWYMHRTFFQLHDAEGALCKNWSNRSEAANQQSRYEVLLL